MSGGYGMEDTDLVYNQGRNIYHLGDPAFSSANGAAQAIIAAAGIVKHPLLTGPLESLGLDCVDDANSLMYSVEGCGGGIAETSNIVVDAENEATNVQLRTVGGAETARTHLDRTLDGSEAT